MVCEVRSRTPSVCRWPLTDRAFHQGRIRGQDRDRIEQQRGTFNRRRCNYVVLPDVVDFGWLDGLGRLGSDRRCGGCGPERQTERCRPSFQEAQPGSAATLALARLSVPICDTRHAYDRGRWSGLRCGEWAAPGDSDAEAGEEGMSD
jgi:hypothetical protein